MSKLNKPRPAAACIIKRHQTEVRDNRLLEPFRHHQPTRNWKTRVAAPEESKAL